MPFSFTTKFWVFKWHLLGLWVKVSHKDKTCIQTLRNKVMAMKWLSLNANPAGTGNMTIWKPYASGLAFGSHKKISYYLYTRQTTVQTNDNIALFYKYLRHLVTFCWKFLMNLDKTRICSVEHSICPIAENCNRRVDRQTDMTDESEFIICPMLCYGNGTDNHTNH